MRPSRTVSGNAQPRRAHRALARTEHVFSVLVTKLCAPFSECAGWATVVLAVGGKLSSKDHFVWRLLHLVLAMLSIPLATDDHAAPQPQLMPYIATARQCLQSCLTCFTDHCLA
jgi:hypothetical protein